MSKILKKIIAPHHVLIDTNVLFDQDKSNIVNPKFDEFWDLHAADSSLHLVLPEVVIGEILFQQTNSALTTLRRANESFDRLSGVTGNKYSHRVTDSRIKKEARKRFYTWANCKKGFKELPTPINSIDWKKLVNASIWRDPPFSFDPKKTNIEKGFRDALILETIYDYCQNQPERKIVFISNDTTLRDATELRLRSHEKFNVFQSLEEFQGYLLLEKENLEQSFIRSVINRADVKFFNQEDSNSLVYKTNLISKIRKKFPDKFRDPRQLLTDDFGENAYIDGHWRPTGPGTFVIISKPQFQKIEGENSFFWNSRVKYEKEYAVGLEWEENDIIKFLHEIYFDIHWKANISINQRFTKMEIIDIGFRSSTFKMLDE